jgi:hypothetical protein
MTARTETYALIAQLAARSISASFDDANTLRRAQLTLHRWCELECGDGNDYSSWSIERDDKTDLPYFCRYPHKGEMRRYRVADREKGALRRIADVCKRIGAHYYYQTDPRGCALYIGAEPLTDSYYNRGVAC